MEEWPREEARVAVKRKAEWVPNKKRAASHGEIELLIVPAPVRKHVIIALRSHEGEVAAIHIEPETASELMKDLVSALAAVAGAGQAEFLAQGNSKFHRRTCKWINPNLRVRYFSRREDAISARLVACATCRP